MKEVKFDKSSNELTISETSTTEIKIPEGYDYVDYRAPNVGEYYYEPAYKSVFYNAINPNMFNSPSEKIIVKHSLVALYTLKPGENFLHKNERYMVTRTKNDTDIWVVSLLTYTVQIFLKTQLVDKL